VKEFESGIYNIKAHSDGMKAVYDREQIYRDYQDYLSDESNVTGGGVEALFFPGSRENISYIFQEAKNRGVKVTISGGRTGICAGAVPEGGYLVSLEKMKDVLSVDKDKDGFLLTAQCGVRLSELSSMLRSRDFGQGCRVTEDFLSSKKLFFYPPDPTETTATLGGTVATNASGARTLHYGPTRRYVQALEVVLSDGRLLRIKRGEIKAQGGEFYIIQEGGEKVSIPAPLYSIPEVKHSAGLYSEESMDLIDLFIGSEGILGVIATVTVRLVEEPGVIFGGVGFFPSERKACHFSEEARKEDFSPLALEYFDNASLELLREVRKEQGPTSEIPEIPLNKYAVYFESTPGDKENLIQAIKKWIELLKLHEGDPEVSWGAFTRRDLQRLKSFRHTVPESVNKIVAKNKQKDLRIHKVGTDMAVPDRYLDEMVDYYRGLLGRYNIRHIIFGHIGNNHLHVNMLPCNYSELITAKKLYVLFAKKAVEVGGTVSAEHGIGKLKKEYLSILFDRKALEQMRAVKKALDPNEILNPGNLI